MTRRLTLAPALVAAATLLGVLAGACTDQSAVAPPAEAPPSATSSRGIDPVGAAISCTVTVGPPATFVCTSANPGLTGARVRPPSGIERSVVTLGGQRTYVALTPSSVSCLVPPGVPTVCSANVTVTNLTTLPMNTTNGTTVDPGGIKVFFNSGPTVTGGSGTVTVENPDGTGTFTQLAPVQPFFLYSNDAILPPGGTTAAKTWVFSVPNTVTSFTFTVYVTTQMPANGNQTPTATIAGSNTGLAAPVGIVRDAGGNLYVANGGSNSITVYAAGANGNVAPTVTIAGSATGLSDPAGIALDGANNLYVANSGGNSITVYAAGATGNVAPTVTIGGSTTGLNSPVALALDPAGNLSVANSGGGGSITVYPAGASGNVAPTAMIAGSATGLSAPVGIARDGSGKLYVANNTGNTITVYSPGVNGNAAPTTTIAGVNTGLNDVFGIALDGAGNLYVANGGTNSITVYAAGATGNATPTTRVALSNTNLSVPRGIALDGVGGLYVTNLNSNSITVYNAGASQLLLYVTNPSGSITAYGAGAAGNVAPTFTITGANTGLNDPYGMTRDAVGNLYVTNSGNNSITVYAAGASGNATPTATIAGSSTGLSGLIGVALDGLGKLYVANEYSNSITVYAAGANGNVVPTATIAGGNTGLSGPIGVALDGLGNLYVTNANFLGESVTVYATAGLSGTVNLAPTATIVGGNTDLASPEGIAVDAAGNIYVANYEGNTITVFAAGANGNVAPTATIAGLISPTGVAVDGAGNLYVVNYGGGSITVYAAGASGNATPTATIFGSNTGLNDPFGIAF